MNSSETSLVLVVLEEVGWVAVGRMGVVFAAAIGSAHGSDYQGVEKENCLQAWLQWGEYHAMLDVIFCCVRCVRLGKPRPHLVQG